jgi:hypothetical protein
MNEIEVLIEKLQAKQRLIQNAIDAMTATKDLMSDGPVEFRRANSEPSAPRERTRPAAPQKTARKEDDKAKPVRKTANLPGRRGRKSALMDGLREVIYGQLTGTFFTREELEKPMEAILQKTPHATNMLGAKLLRMVETGELTRKGAGSQAVYVASAGAQREADYKKLREGMELPPATEE